MKAATEIKNDLLMALATSTDTPLRDLGFHRSARSAKYKRVVREGEQIIDYAISVRPNYQLGADAHIQPHVIWCMEQVVECATGMVEGNLSLLGKTSPSDSIMNLSLEWLAPKEEFQRWFAAGPEQFLTACEGIRSFILNWAIPFLADAQSPSDFVNLYVKKDKRIIWSQVSYTYVVAAYRVLGDKEKAREVVLRHFSKPGIKARYGALFKSLHME